MPTCEYCDKGVPSGARQCPHCCGPRDPSNDAPEQKPQTAQPQASGATGPSGQAGQAGRPHPGEQGSGGVQNILESLQKGDAGGVAKGLQDMAKSGQLDVGKLASDLGVSSGGKGVDLGQVARSLTGGGSQGGQVAQALSKQGGDIGSVIQGAAGFLKSPAGLAVGGAALAAAGVGAGMLWSKSQGEGGGLSGIKDMFGKMMPGGSGGGIGSMLGGSQSASAEDVAQYRQIAEQLPPPTPEDLKEGQNVLARWDQNEWRPGQVGWVDGGQARVTFESGFERWCDPADIRLPPTPEQMQAAHEQKAPSLPPQGQETATYAAGETIQAMWAPDEFKPAKALEQDPATGRVRVQYENGFEVWLEPHQVRKS